MPAAADCLLRIDDLSVRFGGIVALDGVSFRVESGQIAGLIGPNGAGKTTLFNCLSRFYRADSGRIDFDGHSLLSTPRHRIAALGIGRTFQNLALFRSMTVLDNLMIGRHCRTESGFLAHALRLPRVGREERDAARRAEEVISLLGLQTMAKARISDLPFNAQKREIGRAHV